MRTEEIWIEAIGSGGLYEVSSLGRMRSIDRVDSRGIKRDGRILKCSINGSGYRQYCMSLGKECYRGNLHSLIASTFLGEIKFGYCVNHKDGNKENNSVDNLEIVTNKENYTHAVNTGLSKRNANKLTADDVVNIRALYDNGATQKELASEFNIKQSTVSKIVNRKTWKEI